MRNATGVVTFLFLAACSGGASEPPPSAPSPPSDSAGASSETIASEHPFGCTLADVIDGRVVWTVPDGPIQSYVASHEAAPAWIPLPTELASAAPGEGARATLFGADAPCVATLGPAELHTVYEGDFADVGRAIAGCASDTHFALICPDDASVPAALRYSAFASGAITTLDASTTDPMLHDAFLSRAYFGEPECPVEHASDTELVRARASTLTIGPNRIGYAELASSWFSAGLDVATACPEIETLHSAVFTLPAEGDSERIAESASFVGVVHDGTSALALVESGSGDGADVCEGANTCTFVSLWTTARVGPRFLRRSHAVAAMGSGELTGPSSLFLTATREGCDPED